MFPASSAGARNYSTQAAMAWPLIGSSSTSGARWPSALSAQTNVVVCQCPHDAWPARPQVGVMLVVAHVLSKKISRPLVSKACLLAQSWLAGASLARPCPAAWMVFFTRQPRLSYSAFK